MRHASLAALLVLAAAGQATAQADTARRDSARGDSTSADSPRAGPPIRRIATASAVSRQPIGNIGGVRELPDGRVLVNDVGSRRLLLLDTTLATERVVLDSASELANTYGNRNGALIAHRGDSSLFIDPSSLSLLVLDAGGNIARVRSVPRAQDVGRYAGGFGGSAGFTDARGRLVYRVNARPAPPVRPPPRGVPYVPSEPDSAFVVALDMDSRRLDTLGAVRIPRQRYTVRLSPNGGWSFNSSMNPMPTTDEWTVLSDGTVAFVRWIDYRVDYLNPDGSWTSSAKLPYDWQPMSAADKERLVDSVRTAQSRNLRSQYTTSLIRWVNTYRRKYPPGFTAPEGYSPPAGFLRNWTYPPGVTFSENYIYGCAPGEEPREMEARPDDSTAAAPAPAAPVVMDAGGPVFMTGAPPGRPGAGRPSCIPQPIPNLARIPDPPTMREVSLINPRELPDFRPPFGAGAVRADMDGNIWVRTNQVRRIPGGPVYDVVSRAGVLVDRLQLPPGYQLVGFGRGRVVFLSMRDNDGIHLARVRLR
jgi:hypothetical protein